MQTGPRCLPQLAPPAGTDDDANKHCLLVNPTAADESQAVSCEKPLEILPTGTMVTCVYPRLTGRYLTTYLYHNVAGCGWDGMGWDGMDHAGTLLVDFGIPKIKTNIQFAHFIELSEAHLCLLLGTSV